MDIVHQRVNASQGTLLLPSAITMIMRRLRCFEARSQASQAILQKCGNGLSHAQLQRNYIDCCRHSQSGESEIETQRRCLLPLNAFLECARSVNRN